LAPREGLTGIKTDFKRDLRVAFGDYCQILERDTDASMKQRTVGGIAVLPTGNMSGSVLFLSLWTGKIVARDQFTILPCPKEVIELLNKWCGEKNIDSEFLWEKENDKEEKDIVESFIDQNRQVVDGKVIPIQESIDDMVPMEEAIDSLEESQAPEEENESPYTVEERISEDEGITEEVDGMDVSIPEELRADGQHEIPDSNRYDLRRRTNKGGVVEGGAIFKGGDYINFDVSKSKRKLTLSMSITEALTRHGPIARAAIEAELDGHQEKPAWRPVTANEFANIDKKHVLRTMWVIVEKVDANGNFDKVKARLVAVGSQQDRSLYDDTSSPTASTTSIFVVAAIAAMEGRHVVVADVKTAYMHAKIGKIQSFLLLDRVTTEILCQKYEEWKKYLLPNGTSCVEALRAFYGLIESAKLWYDEISRTLKSMGFVPNESDLCVFNSWKDNIQTTVVVYVDDLLITSANKQKIDSTLKTLGEKYGELKTSGGKHVDFLGMKFNFAIEGAVKISMPGYVEGLLLNAEASGTAATPAAANLFEIEEAPNLVEEMKNIFHTRVAKLLYLAKRTRGDILLPVNFLCTRVNAPTEQDWGKLERVLKYLNGTKDYELTLKVNLQMRVQAYVDAAYAPHGDGKSHSGLYLTLGEGAFLVKSTKQQIVTKSSTEAELVAASDMATDVFHLQSFMKGQGCRMEKPVILQDNQSTIKLLEKGRASSQRTRHLNVRFFWLTEKIDDGDLKIQYEPTKSMVADILTKPLGAEQFGKLRRCILNREN
jgi:hypothetical protein